MVIFVIAIAILSPVLVGGAVIAAGGSWLLALTIAQGAGCAAVLGAAVFGNALQHICKTAGAGRAS